MSNDRLQTTPLTQQEDLQLKKQSINTQGTQNQNRNISEVSLLMYKLRRSELIINRIDYYGNAIQIGAFCNAITFIILGFTRCHAFNTDQITFLQGIILIFGSFGQITAGLLEFLKARSYSAFLYLTLGFYCFTNMFIEYNTYISFFTTEKPRSREITLFIWAWFLIIIPLVITSIKINLFFLIQTTSTFFFLLFRWIGEVSETEAITDYVCGIFQLIAGLTSLYIFAYQIIDEGLGKQLLPCIAFNKENDIDFNILHPYRRITIKR